MVDLKTKMCDSCKLFLPFSDFYKNNRKNDGLQNRCQDCIRDYKIKLKQGLIEIQPLIKREFYYIPDIFLVGYGRMQTYQNCCLKCNDPFFCMMEFKEIQDLFCERCSTDEGNLPERNISKINFVGNVVGWLAKIENPSKKRNTRNYSNCYKRDRYTCQYCGYNLENAKKFLPLHIDHIRPWSSSGGNGLTNLVVSCSECNLLVNDKWFNNFEEKKEFILFEKQKKTWDRRYKEEKINEFKIANGQEISSENKNI